MGTWHIVASRPTSKPLGATPLASIEPLPRHADDRWSGAPAGVDGAQFAVAPWHASQPSSCLPWWAHAQGQRPPAVRGFSTERRRTRSISLRVGHGRQPGRFLEVFTRCAEVFPARNDYDHSGTVVGRGSFNFLSAIQSSSVTWPFVHISASGGEAGTRPSVEVVVFFQAAAGSGHVVGRLLAPHPLAGPSFPRHILSPCRSALAVGALGRFTPMGWTA